jgi:hypothetical protein
MAFVLEKNMTPVIEEKIHSLLSSVNICSESDDLLYALELPVHYRMIDVAIALVKKDNIRNLNDFDFIKPLRNLNSRTIDVLTVIYAQKSTTLFLIKSNLGMETEEIKKHLIKLMKLKYIEQKSRFTYSITNWIDILPRSMVSIELKLSKWQEALDQGIYNLRFSDYSFVALDEDQIPQNKDIESYFIKSNVGLIYVNSNGNIRPAYIPKENSSIDMHMRSFQQIKMFKDIVNNKKWSLINKVE